MWLPSNKIFGQIINLSLAAVLIFTSCDKEDQPQNILQQDQLIKIMIECYLGEARVNGYSIPRDSASKLFIPYEASVLKKYGVSDSELKRTYQYYFDHPTQLEKIYEVVLDSLSLRERKLSTAPSLVK